MHSSFTSKLTYTKALYCFSSAWLFAQGANCNGFRNEWSRGRQPLYYIIHNSPDGVGNERSRQATALVTWKWQIEDCRKLEKLLGNSSSSGEELTPGTLRPSG